MTDVYGPRDILDKIAANNTNRHGDDVAQILAERQQQYGHPSINFERIARAWNGIFMTKLGEGEQFTPTDVACAMIAVKLTRLQQGYKRDSATDIEGYARLIVTVNEDEAT